MWRARIFAPEDGAVDPCDSGVDMDDVDEEPDPDGSVWDEIPDPVLQFGDASSCVKYPRWLGRRAFKPRWCADGHAVRGHGGAAQRLAGPG